MTVTSMRAAPPAKQAAEKASLRAFMYARSATGAQTQPNPSIQNQLAAMRAYADARGWSVVRTFVDDGYGGHTDKRPGFQEMIKAALAGETDLILIEHPSRLFRDYHLAETYRRLLDQHRIQTRWITEETDAADARRFKAMMANWLGSKRK